MNPILYSLMNVELVMLHFDLATFDNMYMYVCIYIYEYTYCF